MPYEPYEPDFDFDGQTFDAARDGDRLHAQLNRVRRLMSDHQWRTLADIGRLTGAPQASVSARLRDLRKHKFGGLHVQRQYVAAGLWQYRVADGDTPPHD